MAKRRDNLQRQEGGEALWLRLCRLAYKLNSNEDSGYVEQLGFKAIILQTWWKAPGPLHQHRCQLRAQAEEQSDFWRLSAEPSLCLNSLCESPHPLGTRR
ncbi:hypothetical protein AV530_018460 [Patagioenas fasciata monilis]|uniref:Uncharacterized protein n=1 Tax=Patagioenas fasciata monilis TaxID=372326 RepID=A0A1V4JRX2_PATFA|nr:hypothetical protein AV530_018460 [Patagioenas fasciata monilis]